MKTKVFFIHEIITSKNFAYGKLQISILFQSYMVFIT